MGNLMKALNDTARQVEIMRRERQLSDLLVFISRLTKEQIEKEPIEKLIGDFFINWNKKNDEEMREYFLRSSETKLDLFTKEGATPDEVHKP